jgi:hypothetical protein
MVLNEAKEKKLPSAAIFWYSISTLGQNACEVVNNSVSAAAVTLERWPLTVQRQRIYGSQS